LDAAVSAKVSAMGEHLNSYTSCDGNRVPRDTPSEDEDLKLTSQQFKANTGCCVQCIVYTMGEEINK